MTERMICKFFRAKNKEVYTLAADCGWSKNFFKGEWGEKLKKSFLF